MYEINMVPISLILFFYIFHFSIADDVGDKCTPNQQISEGTCVLITDCEAAVRLVQNKGFHNFYRCGFSGRTEIMCCPRVDNKFGNQKLRGNSRSARIAETECKKIRDNSPPPLNQYIIGGEEASIGEFPHMAAFGYEREGGGVYSFDCGGALVSDRYVLTAAHCFHRTEPSIVRLGVVELGPKTWNENTDVRIAQIITHENYTRTEKYNDVALVRLARPVSFNSYLNAACLYTSPDDPAISLTITGWGVTNVTRDVRSDTLLKANVTSVPRLTCENIYMNTKTKKKLPNGITSQQICAGDPEGRTDTCQGDSGGPLQGLTSPDSHYRVVGVTSFGRGCGTTVPGVYTRVASYLDWIVDRVWTE